MVPATSSLEAVYVDDYLTPHDTEEINCLSMAMFGEAEDQGQLGQLSVGAFLLNRANALNISVCDVTERPYYITSVFLYRKNIDWRIAHNYHGWLKTIRLAKTIYMKPIYREATPVRKSHNHFLTKELAENDPPRWYKNCLDRVEVEDHIFCSIDSTLGA